MDIKPPLNAQNQLVLNPLATNYSNLKIGQKVDVQVISATVSLEKNTILLKFGNSTITVQSTQPNNLEPGQNLIIQVTKIAPAIEFKILNSMPGLQFQQSTSPEKQPQSTSLRLLLNSPAVSENQEAFKSFESSLSLKQQFVVKIVGFDDNKIQLQVFTDSSDQTSQTKSVESNNRQAIIMNIERSQLQLPKTAAAYASNSPVSLPDLSKNPPEIKVGQYLTLETIKTGATPEFRIIPSDGNITQEKLTELVKLFLPRHESSPVLLNQIIKDLPQLIKNENVAQALKRIAVDIVQNLPAKDQLANSQGVKQSISDSGIFLEAKLPPLAENSGLNIEKDFKANLLKFIQAIKQEFTTQNDQKTPEADLNLLKDLQQKTENTMARIVLDQLISLPKEDNLKQIWSLELPFMDRETAEAASIEIEWEKEKDQPAGSVNWSVNITIAPPGLGIINCIVAYRNSLINTYFRSQSTQTAELIKDNLDHLKEQFEDSGLKAGNMNAQDGLSPLKPMPKIGEKKLFDEKV
ncbi:MAG: flagellar hook-length control protein FliK [Methylobacter sp.]|nr:flagellar hook-length control protein FliK [Methylobacter sp.]